MSYPETRRRFGFAAKEESTYASDATPTFSANAIRLIERPEVGIDYLSDNQREQVEPGSLGRTSVGKPGGRQHTLSVRAHGLGPGAAYTDPGTVPALHPILLTAFSASFDVTAGSEKVTYTPKDEPAQGVTCYTEADGKKYVTRGGILTSYAFEATAGENPSHEIEVMGIGDDVVEQALEAQTFLDVDPPVFKDAKADIGAGHYTPILHFARFETGLDVTPRRDANGANNVHEGFRLVDRVPRVTLRMEADSLGNYDPFGDWHSSTARALALTFGDTQYNRFKLDIPETKVVGVSPVELENGISGLEVEYGVYVTPGSADFTLIYS